MEGPKDKPVDQPNEEFIEDQPNRRDQRSHSSDPVPASPDSADDRDDEYSDMDDLTEDAGEGERED